MSLKELSRPKFVYPKASLAIADLPEALQVNLNAALFLGHCALHCPLHSQQKRHLF